MTQKPIYLDYAATTPVDERVAAMMQTCLTGKGAFGNPASRSHLYGWQAEEIVENARCEVAQLIGAESREVIWTSGATEANNLALKGVAEALRSRGRHIVSSVIEHKAVLDVCAYLEMQGFEVSYLQPREDGHISLKDLADVVRDDTILVSLMHVNNEIGVINDIATIGRFCRERNIVLHVDAAQSVGKLPVNVKALYVDLLSLSAHKFYGPKGAGALYVRRSSEVKLSTQIHGGGHERGLRSGTLATHQIAGLGEAARIARLEMAEEFEHTLALRERFHERISDLPATRVNGCLKQRVPGNLNISFAFLDGEVLMASLHDIAVSSGSACTSLTLEPSYVLRALGVDRDLAHSSIRFSFGRYTTEEDVDQAAVSVCNTVNALRKQSKAWKAYQDSAVVEA